MKQSQTDSPTSGLISRSADRWLRRVVDWLMRYRLLLLAACLAAAGLAIGPAGRLSLDRSIEGLFKPGDVRLLSYRDGEDAFGGSETAIVGYSDPKLTTAEGLKRLEDLETRLSELPGVLRVLSLAQAKRPGALASRRSLREHVAAGTVTPEQLRKELVDCELYRGRLLSPDGQTTVLLATLAAVGSGPADRDETIRRIEELCESHRPTAVVSGGPIMVNGVYDHMQRDGRTLGIASSFVLAIVMGVLFRNLRWVLLPLCVVQLSLIWTKATLVISHVQLSMVSSPLVALVTVIGTATVVHVAIRFREERQSHSPEDSLRQTLLHIGPAIFWTCVTTALGFCSLLVSQVVPVGSFGGMMAIGSMFVFVATLGVIPGGVLLGRYHTDPAIAPGEKWMARVLDQVVSAVEHRPWQLTAAVGLLLAFALIGMFRLEVATELDENFRNSSPVVKSFRFLTERMKTTKTIDLLIDAPKMSQAEAGPFLRRVRKLQSELNKQPGVVGAVSIVDVLDFMMEGNENSTGVASRVAAISFRTMTESQRLATLRLLQPNVVRGFWNEERGVMRLMLQVGDVRGTRAKVALVESIEELSRKEFADARTSGISVLLIYLVKSLLADQLLSFGLAVAAILISLTIALRDWRLGLIALLPNAAPIIIVVGSMGWLGLRINVATAMLASVSMGLSADFSIHYLFRFRQELQAGKTFGESLRRAHQSVGMAMVLANIALIAGFSTLTISAFIPTIYFGLLVSVAMVGGLIGNLTALPLLLRVLHHRGEFESSDRLADSQIETIDHPSNLPDD